MHIHLNEKEVNHLKSFLETYEDCEQLSAREYVIDLYGNQVPVTMNFVFVKSGIGVDGAAELKYSDEEDGYYMSERIEDPAVIRSSLEEAGALPPRDV